MKAKAYGGWKMEV